MRSVSLGTGRHVASRWATATHGGLASVACVHSGRSAGRRESRDQNRARFHEGAGLRALAWRRSRRDSGNTLRADGGFAESAEFECTTPDLSFSCNRTDVHVFGTSPTSLRESSRSK
eukprot:4613454-Pyramimonas_sp.AAC.1